MIKHIDVPILNKRVFIQTNTTRCNRLPFEVRISTGNESLVIRRFITKEEQIEYYKTYSQAMAVEDLMNNGNFSKTIQTT